MPRKKAAYLIILLITVLAPLTGAEPLAVYLTWQNDPSTTMTVQWITEPAPGEQNIHFHEMETPSWKVATGASTPLPRKEPYIIHRVELTGLKPGTPYIFRIGNKESAPYKFRTMPADPQAPVRFVAGGDMYHDGIGYLAETNRQAARMNPLFALVGGDIAYAASKKPHKREEDEGKRWLTWLKAWTEQMVSPEGFLIPLLPAIGNHDVNGRYDQPKENAEFFYTLFPFPGKRGYNVMDFGDTLSVFILDSGHTNPIGGEQAQWLQHALEQRRHVPHKFAIYHVPAYPSVRKYAGKRNSLIRQHWVPSFERYSLTAAFEHHDHAYKRTKPIRSGRPAKDGVLYLGDGAWGVKKARRPKKRWYLAKTRRSRHFLLAVLQGNNRYFYGISSRGQVIDSFAHPVQIVPLTAR